MIEEFFKPPRLQLSRSRKRKLRRLLVRCAGHARQGFYDAFASAMILHAHEAGVRIPRRYRRLLTNPWALMRPQQMFAALTAASLETGIWAKEKFDGSDARRAHSTRAE